MYYRDFKNFNVDNFYNDCKTVIWNDILKMNNINDKVEFINKNIITLYDKHAPIKPTSAHNHYSPWITDVIKIMQRKRNKALADYKKT